MTNEHHSYSSPAPKGRRASLDETLNRISLNRVRSLKLHIILGVAALAWVGFVGALVLRPSAPPPAAVAALPPLGTALPPLGTALPPLAEVESNPVGQKPMDFGVPPIKMGVPEPPPVPVHPEVSHEEASLEPAPPSNPVWARARENALPPARNPARIEASAPLPPSRPVGLPPISLSSLFRPAAPAGGSTAVYDISLHTVYLPDGTKLEAHSGLGEALDNPRFASERDRGPTPPGTYELTLRESLFHGVQALRLTPVGDGDVFGRSGLLAHPYMLGPNGDSNGCVSFKNYDAFLRAFQNGQVKKLAVVAEWTEAALQARPEIRRRGFGE